MKNVFKAKEIPFKDLAKIGISKEAFLEMPKEVLDKILTGRLSPLLLLKVDTKKGILEVPAKIAFSRKENGEVNLTIFPSKKEIINDYNLSVEELDKLKANNTIVKTINRGAGKEKCYLQLDEETNTIITAKWNDIHIPETIASITIGLTQREQIREGKPVEIEIDDTKVTVGVDLNEMNGLKVLKGDLLEWKENKMIRWDIDRPGSIGYWKTSENRWQYDQYNKQKYGLPEEEENHKKKSINR